MKSQITNHKSQTISKFKIRNSKRVLNLGLWSLEFVCNLPARRSPASPAGGLGAGGDFGIWNFLSRHRAKGFGLVEIVIVTALVSGALFGFMQAGILSLKLLRNEKENLEATLLAEEAIEAVRAIRDETWGNISWRTVDNNPSLPYYPVRLNDKWSLSTTSPGFINGKYNRYVIFERVNRDSSDKIVSSGGSEDLKTRKLISRATTTTKHIELVTYLTDFQASLTRPQESKAISFEDATTDADLANFPSNNNGDGDPAQSFTTAGAIEVTRVDLFLKRVTVSPSDIYAEIRTAPNGTVLGTSDIINSSTASTTLMWVEFRFPQPVVLAASTVYYLRLRSIPSSTDAGNGSAGLIHWGYKQSPPLGGPGPYANGEARHHIGQLSNPTNDGQVELDKDFGFMVYDFQ